MPDPAYRTETELVLETLGNLGVLETGQIPDVDDVEYVRIKVPSILRTLAGLDICFVPDSNAIPSVIFTPLADCVAGLVAEKFSASPDDFARLTQNGLGVPPGSGAGAMMIKQILRGRPTFEPLRVQYF